MNLRPYARQRLAVSALVLGLAPGTALAQDESFDDEPVPVDSLGLSDQEIGSIYPLLYARASGPGMTLGSPAGFGLSWGIAGVGIGGQTTPSSAPRSLDGSIAGAFGIGDTKSVALDISVAIISIYDDFGADGQVNLKMHHRLSPTSGFALGLLNAESWGQARQAESSAYAVYSKIIPLPKEVRSPPRSMALSIGLGDKQFTSDGDGVNVFGSIQVSPHPCCAALLDWTGVTLNAGISFAPFASLPVSVSMGASDAIDRTDNGVQFVAGLGYSFRY